MQIVNVIEIGETLIQKKTFLKFADDHGDMIILAIVIIILLVIAFK